VVFLSLVLCLEWGCVGVSRVRVWCVPFLLRVGVSFLHGVCLLREIVVGVIEPPKLTPYYYINHSFWSLRNDTELTCRLCWVKLGKSLITKDRKPYIKTHTKASLEINKSQFITSITIKGYLITNRVFCIKVNCSEFINTAEIKLNEKR
jgi:hypothetical protein